MPLSKLLRKTAKPVFKVKNPKILHINHVHGGNVYDRNDYDIEFSPNDGTKNIFDENLPYAISEKTKRNMSLAV